MMTEPSAIQTGIAARAPRVRKQPKRTIYATDSLVARVGVRIRKLRLEQDLSLREFGQRAGVHPFHVMAIELGQLATTAKTLRSIATALGVSPADLLNHGGDGEDLGQIAELLRKRPETIKTVLVQVRRLSKSTIRKVSKEWEGAFARARARKDQPPGAATHRRAIASSG